MLLCCCHPSSIYSWFLKPLSVLHSRFPTKKSWVVAYFFNFFQLFQQQIFFFIKSILCNFVVRTLQYFQKKFKLFLPTKSWKNHPQKLLRKTQIHFFSLLPAQPNQPNQPKQKNSCSKMWSIDQLYIDTQLRHKSKKSKNLGRCGR